jgi:hypothetical protein
MRFCPKLEQLESRETPSSFDPATTVVTFYPAYYPGVPFSALTAPGNESPIANVTGYFASGAAVLNAGVFGAPLV